MTDNKISALSGSGDNQTWRFSGEILMPRIVFEIRMYSE